MSGVEINPYEECRLYTSNSERERWESMATLFGIIVSLDALERAYVRESVSEAQYAPACTRLLAQYKTISKLVITSDGQDGGANVMPGIPVIKDVQHFMTTFKVSTRSGRCYRS
jgi:ESCRT-I complex subunit VPS28